MAREVPATEFETWMQENFTCIDAPKRAYFELPLHSTPESEVARFTYVTLLFRTCGAIEDAEPTLRAHAQGRLKAAFAGFSTEEWTEDHARTLICFWRIRPQLEEHILDEILVTDLRVRLVIPGLDLTPGHRDCRAGHSTANKESLIPCSLLSGPVREDFNPQWGHLTRTRDRQQRA